MRRTTSGWQLCIQWKDGSTLWGKLSDLKGSHPIECAEYAVSQGIQNEPDFNWWVKNKKGAYYFNCQEKERTLFEMQLKVWDCSPQEC